MDNLTIFHNPRCGKSRDTLKLLRESLGEEGITIFPYLETPPTVTELKEVISKLGIKADEFIRKEEKEWKEHFKGKDLSEEELVQAMVTYPKLIQRPIVIKGDQAVIGRPPENVLSIL